MYYVFITEKEHSITASGMKEKQADNLSSCYLFLLPQSMLGKLVSCGRPSWLHYTLAKRGEQKHY